MKNLTYSLLVASSVAISIKSHSYNKQKNYLQSHLSNQQKLAYEMDNQELLQDDANADDWEISDKELERFEQSAQQFEQIASKSKIDELLADPVPVIPKSMQSIVQVSSTTKKDAGEKIGGSSLSAGGKGAPSADQEDNGYPADTPPSHLPAEEDEQLNASNKADDANKAEEDLNASHAKYVNEMYGIQKIIPGDAVYGSSTYVKQMNRFLPGNDEKQQKWSYGWHLQNTNTDYTDQWEQDLHKGGDKATEGYYPQNDEGQDKLWAKSRFQYSGPWGNPSSNENLLKQPPAPKAVSPGNSEKGQGADETPDGEQPAGDAALETKTEFETMADFLMRDKQSGQDEAGDINAPWF